MAVCLSSFTAAITGNDWSQINLLVLRIDHLAAWYTAGVLCIGDAAHAMSPVGGVGINLAIQDAVATANILWRPLKEQQPISHALLEKVQRRRNFPTRITQAFQARVHKGISYKRKDTTRTAPPFFLRMFHHVALLRRLPAWFVGRGVRPERVASPYVSPPDVPDQ